MKRRRSNEAWEGRIGRRGDDIYNSQSLVTINVDKKVMRFISDPSPKIRKSVYTTLGNMMASNSNIIFKIFSKNPLIPIHIFDTIQNDTHFNVKQRKKMRGGGGVIFFSF